MDKKEVLYALYLWASKRCEEEIERQPSNRVLLEETWGEVIRRLQEEVVKAQPTKE